MSVPPPNPDTTRVDRWLVAARVFKTRTISQQACTGGKVSVNGGKASAHRPVRVGDRVQIQGARGPRDLLVLALADRRLPAPAARLLYEDRSPPPAPTASQAPLVQRDRGAGRPSKRDRRDLQRLRRGL